jgi:hypothetical protein
VVENQKLGLGHRRGFHLIEKQVREPGVRVFELPSGIVGHELVVG